jgi:hypothetical protein
VRVLNCKIATLSKRQSIPESNAWVWGETLPLVRNEAADKMDIA